MNGDFLKTIRIDRISDFTGAYLRENLIHCCEADISDLTDIRGTNGYCSDEAAEEIRSRLKDLDPCGTHYLDDGNHHYMTLFWIEKIKEPFDLYVFDHHTDMQPPSLLPVLSCGGWVLTALEQLDNLRHVYLIGPPAESRKDLLQFQEHITFINEQDANGEVLHISGSRPGYISVDLDVLSEKDFKSIWDQGSMSKEKLAEWLCRLMENGNIVGMDICG